MKSPRHRLAVGFSALALAVTMLAGLAPAGAAPAGTGITFVEPRDLYGAIDRAHTVTVTAYTLAERGQMAETLARAGDRLAATHNGFVSVTLDGQAFGGAQDENRRVEAMLRGHHVGVRYSDGPLHAKVALVDRVLYLSDRNFSGGFVVRDENGADRSVVAAMLGFCPGAAGRDPLDSGGSRCSQSLLANDHFWTRKRDALDAETRVLLSQSGDIAIETESFGSGNPVYEALLTRAASGVHVRLIVASLEYRQQRSGGSSWYPARTRTSYRSYGGTRRETEQDAVARLRAAGVDVRVGSSNEKLLVIRSVTWFGSTNATRGVPDQADWGMVLVDPGLSRIVQARFEQHWREASPA